MYKQRMIGDYICVKNSKVKAIEMNNFEFLHISKGEIYNCDICKLKIDGKLVSYVLYGLYYQVSEEDFFNVCIPYSKEYVLETSKNKKIFGFKYKVKVKKKFKFNNLSHKSLKELHLRVFYYIEQIKKLSPDIFNFFLFTISDTLKNLEIVSLFLNEDMFIEVLENTECLFKDIYSNAKETIEKIDYDLERDDIIKNLLNNFHEDINLKKDIFKNFKNIYISD